MDNEAQPETPVKGADLLDTPEAARVLKSKARTLKDWRANFTGPPFIRVQGRVKYRRSDLEAWLEASTVRPGVSQSWAATILAGAPS